MLKEQPSAAIPPPELHTELPTSNHSHTGSNPCTPASPKMRELIKRAEANHPDNTGNIIEDCPHCLGEKLGHLIMCGKYPNACRWFLPFSSGGFCQYPDAVKWIKK